MPEKKASGKPGRIRRFFSHLGPGIIAGASDDDPSAITTYTVAGAGFGYAMLWLPLMAFPILVIVQTMSARLGMITGQGVAGIIRERYPRWVLWTVCALLTVANTFQLGANLGGMASVMEMLTDIHAFVWIPVFGVMIVLLLGWSSYTRIEGAFKWLTLALLAYVAAGILSGPDWKEVARSTIMPRIQFNATYLAALVGCLGSALSPYIFFWQAAQVVEGERLMGRHTVQQRIGATNLEIRSARVDVLSGMGFASIIIYFILLTTGTTLYATGQHHIGTAAQAAEALRPVAGPAAFALFAVGFIGAGMLGIPALAGTVAYAVAEARRWREPSLHHKPARAPRFYGVFASAVALGIGLNFAGIEPVQMLYLAAVLNGVLAPALVALVTVLTSNDEIMGVRANSRRLRLLGWISTVITGAAALTFLISLVLGK